MFALSLIPSDPRIFPSQNLYTNMDYLLSRTHTGGDIEKETRVFRELRHLFEWSINLQDLTFFSKKSLIWYIWKVKNEKLFNAHDFSPMDTTKLASRECSAWLMPTKKRIQEKCSAPMDTTKLASRKCSAWLIANQEEDPRETVSNFYRVTT